MSILGRPKRKQGIKKRAIKKFADSYRVGIAYMGLAELRLKSKYDFSHSYYKGIDYLYEGRIETKDMAYGEISASVELKIVQKHYSKEGAREFDIYPPDRWNNYSQEQYEVLTHNIEGMISNEFSADIYYSHYSEIKGTHERILVKEVGTYYSIEDVLDAISTESEVAWGEVAIKLRDYMDELRVFRSVETELPREITIQTPNGKPVVLEKPWSDVVGYWKGTWSVSQDNISVSANISIDTVAIEGGTYLEDEDYRKVQYGDEIGYYEVRVWGTIKDGNTDINTSRNYSNPDRWERNFNHQGAETLNGAIAISEANLRELYQEFTDYLNSERNYVQVSHGRGYARTTENANEWNYNFGDTYEDITYLDWQDKEHGYPYEASTKKSKSVPQFSSVVAKLRKKE